MSHYVLRRLLNFTMQKMGAWTVAIGPVRASMLQNASNLSFSQKCSKATFGCRCDYELKKVFSVRRLEDLIRMEEK